MKQLLVITLSVAALFAQAALAEMQHPRLRDSVDKRTHNKALDRVHTPKISKLP